MGSGSKADVGYGAQVVAEAVFLEDGGDALVCKAQDSAGIWGLQAHEDAQEGSFAGAGGSHQGCDGTGFDGEA